MKRLDTAKSLALLLLAMVAFYWKIILSGQFSLLSNSETVTQAYAWFHFWVESVRQGTLPLWDPYAFAGRSYPGEMQTAAFYPLHLVLALFPFDRNGLLSPRLYDVYFVSVHLLAAWFMFALIRELGLSRFAAVIAGLCFSIGGFVGRLPWPHMLESSIWLPLQFLFLLRALEAKTLFRGLAYAALSGLALGLSILAGGLHVVMMQGLVLLSVIAYHAIQVRRPPSTASPAHDWWRRAALILVVVVSIGLASGAVQLLPSMEYSARAMRWVNGGVVLPASRKIPYANLRDALAPSGIAGYLFFGTSKLGSGEVLSPYLGVFPLLLAIIGVWKCWGNLWVRYAAGLAFAAILFSLGSYSLLYGLAYAIVPFLWMAREASRFLYLAHFGLVILVAFGAETLFSKAETPSSWVSLNRAFLWLTIACAGALAVATVSPSWELSSQTMFSFLLIFLSYALWRYIRAGATGNVARFLAASLILFDVSAFDSFYSLAENKAETAQVGKNHLDRLLSMRPTVGFLKSQPGPFRVQVADETPLNPGDAFDLQTLNGGAVTMPTNYFGLQSKGLLAVNLLNVRYFLKPATALEPGPVYADSKWKVYKNAQAFPRAWLVHQTAVEPSPETLLGRLGTEGSEPDHVGLLTVPLEAVLEPAPDGGAEDASVEQYSAQHIRLKVRAGSRGLLVLSELYYPGWEGRVNGRREKIYEVDGGLRGMIVPQGESRVTFDYLPRSVLIGGWLSILTFSAVLLLWLISKRAFQKTPDDATL